MDELIKSPIFWIMIIMISILIWNHLWTAKHIKILQMREITARLGLYTEEDSNFRSMIDHLKKFDELRKHESPFYSIKNKDVPGSGSMGYCGSEILQTAVLNAKTYRDLILVFDGRDKDKHYAKVIIEQKSFIANTREHVEKIVEEAIILSNRSSKNLATFNFKKDLQESFPKEYELFGKFYKMVNDPVNA